MKSMHVAKRTSLALAACLLAACTSSPPLQRATPPPAQAALIGMSKPALLACAGAPARSETKADGEHLTYFAGTPPAARTEPPREVAAASASAGRARSSYCRVILRLNGGVIDSVTFAGPSSQGLATNPDCMRIIDRCLAR
jgi:hypothetical protein